MPDEGLSDDFFARVLVPLGDYDILGYPEVLQERPRVPWWPRRGRHMVAAHSL